MAINVKRPEATVEFCTDLDARADWEEAQKRLEDARSQSVGDARLSDTRITDAAREVQAAEQAMEDSILLFRLRAVPRKVWQEKATAHPPREDVNADQAHGVEIGAFYDDLLSSPGTIVSVREKASGEKIEFDPVTDWMPLADQMTDGQWMEFQQKAFEINRGAVARPFSRTASLAMRDSEQS